MRYRYASWWRNIEIPNEIKKLEYQDFEFNVPDNGNITFKISFAPGILPEELPQAREMKTRAPKEVPAPMKNEMAAEQAKVAWMPNDLQKASEELIMLLAEQRIENTATEANAASAVSEIPYKKTITTKKEPDKKK